MKARNTVQLGALLVLLILGYFGWQYLNEEQARAIVDAKKIFSFAPEAIREVSVHRLDEGPTVGVRDAEGTWSIVEPNPTIKPNAELWERLAGQTAELMNERSLPEGALDLEAYGLKVPRLTVGVAANDREHTLRFGYLEPTQTYRYARLDDGPVFLVKKSAVFELDRPIDLLRDAWIVSDHENPIFRLEFALIMTEERLSTMENPPPLGTESDVAIIVERPNAEAPWVQLSPVHTPANQERVQELVKELQYTRGRHYIDEPENYADYGLDPAGARMTIENGEKSGGRQTFYFGDTMTMGEEGGIYVRKEGEPAVFVIDGHITKLFPRINSLRERRLLTHPVADIEKFEYIGRDSRFVLEQDDMDRWAMVEPPLDETDDYYVSQYLGALKSLEGTRFYPGEPAEYGLDNPEARLRLHLSGEQAPVEILLTPNPDEPEEYYVLTDLGEVAGVPKERMAFLLTEANNFRLMSLMQFPLNRAVAMTLTLDGVDYALQKEHNRWVVTAPENYFMPNQQDADALLTAVGSLRAVGTEAEGTAEPGSYGFEAPRFSFTVTLAPAVRGEAPKTLGPLDVGGVVPGLDQQRFARSSTRSGVFRIEQRFIESVEQAVSGIRLPLAR